jgi:uncharacterized LabA/DUF88 family protein
LQTYTPCPELPKQLLSDASAASAPKLFSGDKDYLETVKAVKQLGMRVEIVSWRRSLSQDLSQESSKNVILLDGIKAEIEKAIDPEVEQLMPEEE